MTAPLPGGWATRVGLAVARPRWAMAIAADRRHAGRSGSDLVLVILLVLAATQLRGLVAATWLGAAVDVTLGLRAAVQVLTRALTLELAFLLVAAMVLWLAGGARRDLGRAFDLACVAALPLLLVELVAGVAVRALDVAVPGAVSVVLTAVSFAWAGGLVALALGPARRRAISVPAPPPADQRPARIAGLAVVVVCGLGLALQSVWIARHLDLMRPMTDGDPAPAFALPRIGADGAPGAPLALGTLRGKVVVLDFWATWCGPCLKAMPKLAALAAKHPSDVAVVTINLDDAREARALWDQYDLPMELLADDGEVSARYGVSTIPHSVVIDRDGVVRLVARGGAAPIDQTVEALLR